MDALTVNATGIALLAAVALAATPAVTAAAAADDEAGCRQPHPDDPALRVGRVIGRGPAVFLLDAPGCPGPAASCRSRFHVKPGETLLLGKAHQDYTCAFHPRAGGAGWIPAARVLARPVEPAPPLAAWVGTWRLYDDKIVLKQQGDSIEADGEAYWPAKNVMPSNEGGFDGTAKPSGKLLHFGDDPPGCMVDMALLGPFLVVADNRDCGGHNVSFTGVFSRRSRSP